MAIWGTGIDIIQIYRIELVIKKFGNKFPKRILALKEYDDYCKQARPARFLAKRFAAKEAVAKAFGLGMRDGLAFNQFEISHNAQGKPIVILHKKALQFAIIHQFEAIHLSLSDEKFYTCAFATIEINSAINAKKSKNNKIFINNKIV